MEEQQIVEVDRLGWQDEVHVMSEVHVGCMPKALSCMTIFSITQPVSATSGSDNCARKRWDPETCFEERELKNVEYEGNDCVGSIGAHDDNGDLILRRRPKRHRRIRDCVSQEAITIYHLLTTPLPTVGLQIWRGALLLADFILDTQRSSHLFHDVNAIELGAGTGLTGIVMAKAAKRIFITDRDAGILDNCTRNVLANSSLYPNGEGNVQVRKLDWLQTWPPVASSDIEDRGEEEVKRDETAYFWSDEDLEDAKSASVLLAADVVYSPELTQAFFEILDKMMSFGSNKTLFLTLEKRFNFSMNELDVVAHGYNHFRSCFHIRGACKGLTLQDVSDPNKLQWKFEGRKIPTEQVQKYIVEYERGNDLELWEITRCQCHEQCDKFSEVTYSVG